MISIQSYYIYIYIYIYMSRDFMDFYFNLHFYTKKLLENRIINFLTILYYFVSNSLMIVSTSGIDKSVTFEIVSIGIFSFIILEITCFKFSLI